MDNNYFSRHIKNTILQYRTIFPVVGIVGPRQCGKSTLVKHLLGNDEKFTYFDLENYQDLEKISSDPLAFFESHKDKLICMDEIQKLPGIFQTLRGVIDKDRINGKFIVLGSASPNLIGQTAESLAGRIGFIELTPFHILEIEFDNVYRHWTRGGFPNSFLADNDESSFIWRDSYIKTVVERDIQEFRRVNSLHIMKLLQLLAHNHGKIENLASICTDLSKSESTISSYVGILESMYLLRRLQPYHTNSKKRLVKKSKLYIRDTGILHVLARIRNYDELLMHPLKGHSFEGYVIENLVSIFDKCEASFYCSKNGNEIDLILKQGDKVVAIEIKTNKAPSLTKSGILAIKDISPTHICLVVPSYERVYTFKQSYGEITIGSLPQIISTLQKIFSIN